MKRLRTLPLIALFGVCQVFAQPPAAKPAPTPPPPQPIEFGSAPQVPSPVVGAPALAPDASLVATRFQLSGPLVRPFKGWPTRSHWKVPLRLLQSIDPFSPLPGPANDRERAEGLSERAWSTVAGWRPGASAFPDAITHESQMGLISASFKSRP